MNDVPKDFITALKADGLDNFFAGCTSAHRREYLKWIEEAKRPETRQKRIAQAVKMLSAKLAKESTRSKRSRD